MRQPLTNSPQRDVAQQRREPVHSHGSGSPRTIGNSGAAEPDQRRGDHHQQQVLHHVDLQARARRTARSARRAQGRSPPSRPRNAASRAAAKRRGRGDSAIASRARRRTAPRASEALTHGSQRPGANKGIERRIHGRVGRGGPSSVLPASLCERRWRWRRPAAAPRAASSPGSRRAPSSRPGSFACRTPACCRRRACRC